MRPAHRKATKTSENALPGASIAPSPKEFADSLDVSINALLARPPAQWDHDVNLKHLTAQRFHDTVDSIRACEKVGVWRLTQSELSDDAGFYVAELAVALAKAIATLVENGDVVLARGLPGICQILQSACDVYGAKLIATVKKHLSIQKLLVKDPAKELLAMLAVLHPDWHLMLLHTDDPAFEGLPKADRIAVLLKERRQIESLPEESLRALLVTKQLWVRTRQGKRNEELRPHRIAELIENITAVREGENQTINLFVEHLWHGYVWGLPEKTFLKCAWHGRKDLPPKHDVKARMKLVVPFLREMTGGNAGELRVFQHMLVKRKSVYSDGRLANDKPEYIWNQVENRIRKAWKTMASRANKRNLEKAA